MKLLKKSHPILFFITFVILCNAQSSYAAHHNRDFQDQIQALRDRSSHLLNRFEIFGPQEVHPNLVRDHEQFKKDCAALRDTARQANCTQTADKASACKDSLHQAIKDLRSKKK